MTRTAEQIAADIRAWNTVDIADLAALLRELSECRDEYGDEIDASNLVDMDCLPSAEIPADIDTAYPVWAVDQSGNALVGDDANSVETLDEIRRYYAERG